MGWIPFAAWGAALLIALVVLGFCGYELVWKANRLRRDVARLQGVAEQMSGVQAELAITQQRLAAARGD